MKSVESVTTIPSWNISEFPNDKNVDKQTYDQSFLDRLPVSSASSKKVFETNSNQSLICKNH